jgi:NDP-sugar pyrophosphorylase family protein
MMQAVVLAGGKGERLMPLTAQTPKVMLPIGGKPVLEHTLARIKETGIRDICISVYHQGEKIIEYFKDGAKLSLAIRYARLEALRGSAGDFKDALCKAQGTVLLIYGDNFSGCDLRSLIAAHKSDGRLATIALFNREINPNSGIVGGCVRLDPQNRIQECIEGKGAVTPYVNAGMYVLEPKILEYIPAQGIFDFGRDLFPLLLSKGQRIYGYLMPKDEFLFGIDTIECYQRAQEFYRKISRI